MTGLGSQQKASAGFQKCHFEHSPKYLNKLSSGACNVRIMENKRLEDAVTNKKWHILPFNPFLKTRFNTKSDKTTAGHWQTTGVNIYFFVMEMTSNMPVARTEMLRHYTLNIKLTDEPHLSPLADYVPSDHVTFFPQLFIIFLFHLLKK